MQKAKYNYEERKIMHVAWIMKYFPTNTGSQRRYLSVVRIKCIAHHGMKGGTKEFCSACTACLQYDAKGTIPFDWFARFQTNWLLMSWKRFLEVPTIGAIFAIIFSRNALWDEIQSMELNSHSSDRLWIWGTFQKTCTCCVSFAMSTFGFNFIRLTPVSIAINKEPLSISPLFI